MDNLNYKPVDGWAADFIPFFWQDCFHLFYLKDYRDIPGHGEGTPWSHLVTRDFIHYTDEGLCLPRGTVNDQDLYVFTGSVMRSQDGLFHIFYTGHNPYFPAQGKPQEAIMHATSKDLYGWTKVPEDVFYAPRDYFEADDWRDPFVYWNAPTSEYWMLTAARLLDGPSHRRGCTAICTSLDLHSWKIKDIFYGPSLYSVHECPDYFTWGAWRYLIFSEGSEATTTHYRMMPNLETLKTIQSKQWITPKVDTFDTRAFYAAKTASTGNHRYLFGWNPTRTDEKDTGAWNWGGNLVVHELVQESDGSLSVKIPDPVGAHFEINNPVNFNQAWGRCLRLDNGVRLDATSGFSCAFSENLPKTCKLDLLFNYTAEIQSFGIMLHVGDDFESGYTLRIEPQRQRIVVDSYPRPGDQPFMPGMERPLDIQPGKPVHLVAYVNEGLCEVYLDNKVALSTRFYDHTDGMWGIFASVGKVDVTAIHLATSR